MAIKGADIPDFGKLAASVPHLPAREARWVHYICNPVVPLVDADQTKLWTDLQEARGGGHFEALEQSIRWARPGSYEKHFVTGHAGSGKSTELLRLKGELQKEKDGRSYHVVYMDANAYLDMGDVQLPDFLAAFLPALLDDPVLDAVHTATLPVMWRRIRDLIITIGPDVAAEMTKGIPVLSELFKLQHGFQERFRDKVGGQTTTLIRDLGELFQEIRTRLLKQGIDDFIIIADNLEKISLRVLDDHERRTNHDLFFCDQLPAIQSLPVHLILSLPLALHLSQTRMRQQWSGSKTVMVPMVHVRRRGDKARDEVGVGALRGLLGKRVDLKATFESEEVIDRVIAASGGCVRDLLRLVRHTAVGRGVLPLRMEDVNRAIQTEVSDVNRVLQGRSFLSQLHDVARDGVFPEGFSDADKQWLLHQLMVVEYNGDTWYDVHPFASATLAYNLARPKEAVK